MRVLITGSAGAIGTAVIEGMKDRYELRGFDLQPTATLDDFAVGDVADYDAVLAAAEGMDAIVHLGGVPRAGSPWEDVLQSNIRGTRNVLEAARVNGVRRVAYASRGGVLPASIYPRSVQRNADMKPFGETEYSVSKVFGEAIGWMYSQVHGIEFVAVRIGNFKRDRPQPEHPHHLSHGDAARVFEAAVAHPGVKFEIVFDVSDSNWPLYDVEHGRKAIGYYPQDISEVSQEVMDAG